MFSLLAAGMAALLSSRADAGDIAYGEYLASECVTCHQISGADKGIPSIVGWPEDQFLAIMKAYKYKALDNEVMQTIARRLSDEEMEALAAYFGSLKRSDATQGGCAGGMQEDKAKIC
jgi:cytochrome c553